MNHTRSAPRLVLSLTSTCIKPVPLHSRDIKKRKRCIFYAPAGNVHHPFPQDVPRPENYTNDSLIMTTTNRCHVSLWRRLTNTADMLKRIPINPGVSSQMHLFDLCIGAKIEKT